MKKIFFSLLFLLTLTFSFVGCQDEVSHIEEIEMIQADSFKVSESGLETNASSCTYGDTGFSVVNDQDPFFLEISTMLYTNFPPGPPPPPGLVTYEFEFNMCGNQKTTYYRTISDTDLDAVSHYFYWQLISKAGACDGEVRARIVDCGNGSPSEWTDTRKIKP